MLGFHRRNLSVGLLISVMSCLCPHSASSQCVTNGVTEIVNSVVQHELSLAPSQGRWMYLAGYKKDGVQIVARKIQTDDGILTWVLSRNQEPLSPAEIETQLRHLDDLASDSSFLDTNRKAMRDDALR